MNERRKIEDRLRRKEQEVAQLEAQIREARIYIQALQDVLKLLPKDQNPQAIAESTLRPGSAVARAREAILRHGDPVHITTLLAELGLEINRDTRASLAGSLAGYVRRGEIFTRPAPNTFGLIEQGHTPNRELRQEELEPPDNFGGPTGSRDSDIPF